MSNFGNGEPEDAWDAGDTREEHVRNLIRRYRLLDPDRKLNESSPNILDQIEALARDYPQRDDRVQVRIEQLLEDIATTRAQ